MSEVNQEAAVAPDRSTFFKSGDNAETIEVSSKTGVSDPGELAAEPADLQNMPRAEVVRRLELIAALRPGDNWPEEFRGNGNWGEPLSALAARAAGLLRDGALYSSRVEIAKNDAGQIDRRLFDALVRAGRSALGMPSTVDTFKAMLNDAGLALVLAPKGGR